MGYGGMVVNGPVEEVMTEQNLKTYGVDTKYTVPNRMQDISVFVPRNLG